MYYLEHPPKTAPKNTIVYSLWTCTGAENVVLGSQSPDLVVVVHRFNSRLPHPLQHESVTEGDGEDRQEVGSYELVENEGPLVGLRGKAFHAVMPGTIPVSLFDPLVQENRDGEEEGTWRRKERDMTG